MIRRPPRSTLFPYTTALPICHPLGEDAVDVHPDDAHAILLRLLSTTKREPAGDTTTTDPRSRRIRAGRRDRKSTRLNSSHANISYAVFCLKKKRLTVVPPQHS